ncbi:hypothetical protein CC86DRAFT_285711 [Ophiobolus disseminans]|uniref:Uncharacterized protein n=1 Tax=Ophiobolus disseminans TaxID=1469910 RepID=A0A6A7A9G7_9PLEO|nr:hypothetical protein CC86DRAFT_285711 [Ophiobolus disseminans]
MDRPSTPPPVPYGDAYLLTPPPTAKFDKRVTFVDDDLHRTSARLDTKLKEGESPTLFFEDFQECSEVEVEASDVETIPSTSDSSSASPSPSISSADKSDVLEKNVLFASSTASSVVTEPFPFMRLPLSIREKVYEHLLVIPALICVRQENTISQDRDGGHLYTEGRDLVTGIAYALAQLTVDGYKARFSRFASTNGNILLASKEVHAEAKAVLYGKNNFEIAKPLTELSPPTDFSVRLFPTGCQRLVTRLNIRIRSFYGLQWLLSGGYNVIKNYYRGITTLTLILELPSTSKGFGKQWAKTDGETSTSHVQRLQDAIARAISADAKAKKVTKIPAWINLRVMFSGESYHEKLNSANTTTDGMPKHEELRDALTQAWATFKKGGR